MTESTPVVRLPGTRKSGLFRYDGEKWVEVDAAAELRKVEIHRDELLEENQEWSSLIGQIYVLLQQDDAKGALELIRKENIVTFKDGSPVAVSWIGVLDHNAEAEE